MSSNPYKEAIIEHLKLLLLKGQTHIPIDDETVEQLRTLFQEDSLQESQQMPDLSKIPSIILPPLIKDKELLLTILKAQIQSDSLIKSQLRPGCNWVFGTGNPDARIVIVGEAPGEHEEQSEKPFTGRAGQLLREILVTLCLNESNVFITNIMLWRPTTDQNLKSGKGNRPPSQKELEYCIPYFNAQINIVNPSCIIALGATAINGLLGVDNSRKITSVRGTWATFNNIPVMQTFHPSYLLRTGSKELRKLFAQDIIEAKKKANMEISNMELELYK